MPGPTTNDDGQPVAPLTEDQRFLFDTRGWLLLPGLLDPAQITAMKEFCYQLKNEPDTLPAHQRSSIGGPLEALTDHPAVVGFMDEFAVYARALPEDEIRAHYRNGN